MAGTYVFNPSGGPQIGQQILVIDESSVRVSNVTSQSAMVHWTTNFPSTTVVEYGLSTNYTKTTNEDKTLVLSHTDELYSLLPGRVYHYRVLSIDAAGNLAVSGDHTFETLLENLPPDPVKLEAPTNITENSMYLAWSMSEVPDFSKYVLYRDSTDAVTVNSTKVFETDSRLYTGCTVTGLNPSTRYYFRVFVYDTYEVATGSNVVVGTTEVQNLPPSKPVWKTPVAITCDSIILAWEAIPDSDFASLQIFRGDSPSVDTLSHPVVTLTDKNITSFENTSLQAGRTYYYRAYAFDTARYNSSSEVGVWSTHSHGKKLFSTEELYHCSDLVSHNGILYTAGYRSVYKIDGTTGVILASQELNLQDSRLALDNEGRTLYISYPLQNLIYVLSASDLSVITTLTSTPMPAGLAINRRGTHLYAASYTNRRVDIYKTSTKTFIKSIETGEFPFAVAAGRNTDRIYVANLGSNNVTVIDDSNMTQEVTIPVGNSPVDLFPSIGGNYIYVACRGDSTVSWIDVSSNTVVDAVLTGPGPVSVVQGNNGKYLFVANMDNSTVSVIDATNNVPVNNLRLSLDIAPRSLEISEDSSRLFVLSYSDDRLTAYAVSRMEEARRVR